MTERCVDIRKKCIPNERDISIINTQRSCAQPAYRGREIVNAASVFQSSTCIGRQWQLRYKAIHNEIVESKTTIGIRTLSDVDRISHFVLPVSCSEVRKQKRKKGTSSRSRSDTGGCDISLQSPNMPKSGMYHFCRKLFTKGVFRKYLVSKRATDKGTTIYW